MTQQRTALDRTGLNRQLFPEEEQVVGSEQQLPREPGVLPRIEDVDRRIPPGPAGFGFSAEQLPTGTQLEQELARQQLIGLPVLFSNRFEGTNQDFQDLVRWDIQEGLIGDLHEISLATNNAAKTRYQIFIGDREMSIPNDRQVSANLAFPFRSNHIPGARSVTLKVRSSDGTSIIVDGFITGTER